MQQKRNYIALAIVMMLAFTLTACGAPRKSAAAQGYTFTDALGRTVTVESPEKVAALQGSYADVWQLAGGTLYAVTEDAYVERDLGLPSDIVNLGSMKSPSIEQAIAAGVDFMILSSKIADHVAMREALEAAGINCAYFEVETFDDYWHLLDVCTNITGRRDLYETNGTAVRARIDAAIEDAKGKESPKVLFIRAFSTGAKAKGSDNMTGQMLKDLGCINIADSDSGLLEEVSMEKIIKEDPDFIFVATMGASDEKALAGIQESLIANPAWAGLTAVKNDRYVVLPKDLFHYKPNARWGESYEMLAEILYPEK